MITASVMKKLKSQYYQLKSNKSYGEWFGSKITCPANGDRRVICLSTSSNLLLYVCVTLQWSREIFKTRMFREKRLTGFYHLSKKGWWINLQNWLRFFSNTADWNFCRLRFWKLLRNSHENVLDVKLFSKVFKTRTFIWHQSPHQS